MYTWVNTHKNKTPLQQTLQEKLDINLEKDEIRSSSLTLPKTWWKIIKDQHKTRKDETSSGKQAENNA